ncbi:MAG TPA: hypothetical protein VMY37_28335 [Thermoguttaceae bacterium]|nr:hypothetical protein [Thermoguttaceae bacterium]
MIASRNPAPGRETLPAWHDGFLAMVPRIRRYADFAFRHLAEEARAEAVAETVANALLAYLRLFQQGKVDLAYPTVLARYAVAQIHDGRKVGNALNARDVLAERAQKRHGFVVERLDRFDKDSGKWIEAMIEDTETPVPDQAAFRCDFPAWLATHSTRHRRVAEALALSYSTGEVAKRFKVSRGRISQLRRELHDSWLEFHGKASPGKEAAVDVS